MAEHGFSVPESLRDAIVTDRIGLALGDAADGGQTRRTRSRGVGAPSSARVGGRGGGGGTSSSSPRLATKRTAGENSSSGELRGGRVRGRADAKVTSSKARERHQVKPSSRPGSQPVGVGKGQQGEGYKDSGDGSDVEGEGVDWGEVKRSLQQIAENDKHNSMASTLRGADSKEDRGLSDGDGDYEYADDFEEYDALDVEDSMDCSDSRMGDTSTLRGERIRQVTEQDSPVSRGYGSDGSSTLRIESKDTDVSGSAAFHVVSPSWRISSVRPHTNDRTLGTSACGF